MANKISINAKLYSEIQSLPHIDSDKLVAVFCILKSFRAKDSRYKPKGKLKHYGLLKAQTNLSLNSLKKYVPYLIELGVVNFSKDGGVHILGKRKINRLYTIHKTKREKSSIVLEGNNLKEFTLSSYFFKVKSKERRIKKAIDRTNIWQQRYKRYNKGYILSTTELKCVKRLIRQGITLENLQDSHKKVVLSNEGFYYLRNEISDKKSCGAYWKNKLIKAKKIEVKQNFKKLQKATKNAYFMCREVSHFQVRNKLRYINGYICEQLPSTFTTDIKETSTNKGQVVGQGFDFLAFLQNS